MTSKLAWIVAASALATLAACGGGGGGDSAAAAEEAAAVPDGALASVDSFSTWVGARPASDTKDPLAMNSAMPPSSESAEPTDID